MNTRTRLAALNDKERAQWLDPAEKEFCALGYEKASLNRILTLAGTSKGRSYHYFSDKGQLYRATLERRLSQVSGLETAGALAAPDATAFWHEIALLCDGLTRALQHDAALASLVRTLHQEMAAQQACVEPLAALRHKSQALVVAGQSVGAVRDDLPTSLLGDIALDLALAIDRWFALNAASMSQDEEAVQSKRAFSLLIAPFLPSTSPERPQA